MQRSRPHRIAATTLLTAWPDPLAMAAPTPWRGWEPGPRGSELWRRMTAWYAQLRALPRRMRRALQRQLALPLAGVALLLALGHAPAQAATIAVDGTTCSLVDAITAANTDMAQGGCLAGSGADILVLEPPGSTVTLTRVDNSSYGPTGLPVIRSTITIAGQGGTIARASSAPAFRLVAVGDPGNLTLQEVTLTGGVATPPGNSYILGGGLLNYNGTVTIEDSTISGNTGIGVYNESYAGSAILTVIQSTISGNTGSGVGNESWYGSATLTVIQSTIAGNTGSGVGNESWYGGATDVTITQSTIVGNSGRGVSNCSCARFAGHATVTLTQSTISGNTGGGVANGVWYFATLTVSQSTISDNTASDGGGVRNSYNRVTLTQSTIVRNTASGRGGGVFNHNGSVMLLQSTISGNTAAAGSGVHNDGYYYSATATLLQSTITGNTASQGGGGIVNAAATFVLAGSLVAGNLAPTAPEVRHSGGILTANAFNLFGFNGNPGVSGFTPGPTDLVPSEPLSAILDPILADNGGPTLTHALVPSSPAIDAIPWGTNGCGTTLISDQRWQARPQPTGDACDIGAYEVEVDGQALGAWVTGVTPHTAVCENVTTGQAVTLHDPASPWDCEAEGLLVTSRDQVALRARGPVTKGATDVGGAVVGMVPSSGGCTNLTTGQQVTFQHMKGATAGSCVAAGLVIHPKDSVQIRVQGVAE